MLCYYTKVTKRLFSLAVKLQLQLQPTVCTSRTTCPSLFVECSACDDGAPLAVAANSRPQIRTNATMMQSRITTVGRRR